MADRSGTLIVVDDDKAVLSATARQIGLMGYDVVPFHNPSEALESLETGFGDCLIVDLRMPGMSGLELQTLARRRDRPLVTIFLSAHATIHSTVDAMRIGAFDFLEKPIEHDVLERTIQSAMDRYACELTTHAETSEFKARHDRLTARQNAVLRLLLTGASNKVIARRLGIGERTVKAHRRAVMERMEAKTLAELYSMAVQLELEPTSD